MKKNLSRLVSAAMALAMTAAVCVPAFAEDPTEVKADQGEAKMPLVTTLDTEATIISVAIPATIPFQIGINDDGSFKEAAFPTDAAIINNSNKGVYVYLNEVADNPDATLLDKLDITMNKTVLDPAMTAPAKLAVLGENGDKVALHFAASAKAGKETAKLGIKGDRFVITTTLKVSKTAINAPAPAPSSSSSSKESSAPTT